jgi:hypothetical protein
MHLRIGGITFQMISADDSLAMEAVGPAQHFAVAPGEPDVRLTVAWSDRSPEEPRDKVFDASPLWNLYREGDGYVFRFSSSIFDPQLYKTARFGVDFTSGEVCLNRACFPPNVPVNPLEYPLDELLMSQLLARGRGVEVHACGLQDVDGRGYLFIGMSGAGKSTTAGLWRQTDGAQSDNGTQGLSPKVEVLSDDRIILRRLSGRLWMYGTPWHGEVELASPLRAPVNRIFFLARGKQNELAPLRAPEAVARMMSCSFVPFFNSEGLEFSLEFLQQVAQEIPCLEYKFVPDVHAVEFVRKIDS